MSGQDNPDSHELSSYAFNAYGSDAKLYNGIHDLETKAALADRLLACLKQSRRTLWECAEDTAGTLNEALFREDVAQCDALIAEAEALGERKNEQA